MVIYINRQGKMLEVQSLVVPKQCVRYDKTFKIREHTHTQYVHIHQ